MKLALVALVLMPAAAFAADRSPEHAPGVPVAVVSTAPKAATAPAPAKPGHKHQSSGKAGEDTSSSIADFLHHLRGEDAGSPAALPAHGWKHAAAAVSVAAAPDRMLKHQPA